MCKLIGVCLLFKSPIMKVALSGLVTDIRGKLGNAVASRSRAGNFFRERVNPRNSPSERKTNLKSNFRYVINQWRLASPTVKGLYEIAAPSYTFYNVLGEPYAPNAFQLFVYLNLQLAVLGAPIVTAPPDYSLLTDAGAAYSTFDVGTGIFNLEGYDYADVHEYLKIYVSDYYPASVNRVEFKYKYLYGAAYDEPPLNLYTNIVELNRRAPEIGEKIAVKSIKIAYFSGLTASVQTETVSVVDST